MRSRWWIGLALAISGVVVWILAREHLSLEALAEVETRLREVIDERPARAFALGFVIYAVVSMVPGTTGKAIVCGWLFGFWKALVMVVGALTLAAVGGFCVARFLLQEVVERRFPRALGRLQRSLGDGGPFYLLAVRLLQVPYTLVNYVSGASGARVTTFAWTTAVGLVPSTAVFVGVGAGLPTLRELSVRGGLALVDPLLLVALLLLGLAPWALRWLARRLYPAAGRLRPSDS